jgi:hypothetical protein
VTYTENSHSRVRGLVDTSHGSDECHHPRRRAPAADQSGIFLLFQRIFQPERLTENLLAPPRPARGPEAGSHHYYGCWFYPEKIPENFPARRSEKSPETGMQLFIPQKFPRVYLAHWLKDPRNSTTPCCFPIHHTNDVSGCSPQVNFPVFYLEDWLKDPGTVLLHAAFPFILPTT